MTILKPRNLGLVDYQSTWQQMRNHIEQEHATDSDDELWLLQHPRVFTQGQAGKPEHLLDAGEIPVVMSDRGGQITYHGPGQLVGYPLIKLKRLGIGVRRLVNQLEQCLINALAEFEISAQREPGAPGVYVAGAKIAALGLRIRKGMCSHGFCINVDMDLAPFERINPCGYHGLQVTQMSRFVAGVSMTQVQQVVLAQFCSVFGYDQVLIPEHPDSQ